MPKNLKYPKISKIKKYPINSRKSTKNKNKNKT